MVTTTQLHIVQSPITSLISTVSSSVTVKLDDSNYLVWSFQINLLLDSHGILGFVDGSKQCPPRFLDEVNIEGVETDAYQVWKMHDRALMQLLIATLSSTAISCVLGSTTSHAMWTNLKERFSTVTKTTIFQMKTELQNIQKGSDSVSVYLQRIKDARDHLAAAGVRFDNDDIIILALKGLSADYNTFRCVIRGRENEISLKEFRSQLLTEEAIIGQSCESSLSFGTAMVASTQSEKGKALSLDHSSSQDYSFNGGSPSNGFHSGQGSSSSNGSEHINGSYGNTMASRGYKGTHYRGKGRGRFQYNNGPRFHSPPYNSSPGILGAPKAFQHTCPDHPNKIPTCQICNKKGHVAADCFQRHNTSTAGHGGAIQCQICWKFGHSAT